MAHIHPVYDTDIHFKIDPVTRNITTENELKNIIQFDHNSERFSFDIPKTVDGHDMTKCNKVRVHYINTDSANRSKTSGVYEVTDMQPLDDDTLVLTWLITANATQKVGPLDFLVEFLCTNEAGEIEYAWHTGIFSSIPISTGMNNSPDVVNTYPDILEQWKAEILAGGGGGGASSWSDLGETTVTGDTLTWDGNTDGLVLNEELGYKVSDVVPSLTDVQSGGSVIMTNQTTSSSFEIVITDLSADLGIECYRIDTLEGAPVGFGITQTVDVYERGLYLMKTPDYHISSLTINGYNGFEMTETVPLPNKYLDFIETVGGDTLTWDGDTSGLESIDIMGDGSLFYRVTEVYPTLEEAQGGGVAHDTTGFGAEVSCADMTENFGVGGYFLTAASGAIPAFCISQNTTVEGLGDLYKGVYLQGGISSLTINGYTGFTKEQVKEEYIKDVILAVLEEKGLLS